MAAVVRRNRYDQRTPEYSALKMKEKKKTTKKKNNKKKKTKKKEGEEEEEEEDFKENKS